MDLKYDQSGSMLAIAGLVAQLLTRFLEVSVTTEDVMAIISVVLIVVGIVKQWIAHKDLATGARMGGMVVGGLRD